MEPRCQRTKEPLIATARISQGWPLTTLPTQHPAVAPRWRDSTPDPGGSALFLQCRVGEQGTFTVAGCNIESVMSFGTARQEARLG